MTVRVPTAFMEDQAYHARDDREALSAATGGRSGVINTGDLAVAQNGTPNMSVNVSAGTAIIPGSEAVDQGSYLLYNDATLNLAIAAADPTNPRQDLVVAKCQDSFYSGGVDAGSIVVVTGTPAGSPVDPAVPANAIVLARVAVAALAATIVNANIADLRTKVGGPELGYAQAVANQGGITTVADLTNLAVTVNVPAGRKIKVSFEVAMASTVDGDTLQVDIQEGATILQQVNFVEAAANGVGTMTGSVRLTPTAGAHTYKLTAQRSGSGTGSLAASANQPAFIQVEDMGAV